MLCLAVTAQVMSAHSNKVIALAVSPSRLAATRSSASGSAALSCAPFCDYGNPVSSAAVCQCLTKGSRGPHCFRDKSLPKKWTPCVFARRIRCAFSYTAVRFTRLRVSSIVRGMTPVQR